jgi:hypothetical protein
MHLTYPEGIDRSRGCTSTAYDPNKWVVKYNVDVLDRVRTQGQMHERVDVPVHTHDHEQTQGLQMYKNTQTTELERKQGLKQGLKQGDEITPTASIRTTATGGTAARARKEYMQIKSPGQAIAYKRLQIAVRLETEKQEHSEFS